MFASLGFFLLLGALFDIWFYTVLSEGYIEIATEFTINRKWQGFFSQPILSNDPAQHINKKLWIDAVSLFHALFKFPGDDRLI